MRFELNIFIVLNCYKEIGHTLEKINSRPLPTCIKTNSTYTSHSLCIACMILVIFYNNLFI